MHFLKSSTLLLLSTCLAQVLAGPGGQREPGNGIQAFGNQRDQADTEQGQGGPNAQNRNQSAEDCDKNDQGNGQAQANGQNDGNGRNSQGLRQHQNQDSDDGQDNNDGNGNDNNQNGAGRGNGEDNDQDDNQAQAQISTVTMTVTTQIAAATAQPLTVMTITVTAPCAQGAAQGAGDQNAISTSVIAAPTATDGSIDGVATVRKFVTMAADITPGLTSLPVAVASALGADPSASPGVFATDAESMVSSSIASASSSAAAVTSAAAAPAATDIGSDAFAGVTFTTSGDVVPGKSTIPITLAVPSAG